MAQNRPTAPSQLKLHVHGLRKRQQTPSPTRQPWCVLCMLPRQAPPHLSPAPSPSQPVYHSALNDVEPTLCGCSLLPVHGGGRGPAPAPTEGSGAQQCFTRNAGGTSTLHALDAAEEADIVDETIYFFRANVLFKSFEIQGGADRVLVYLTLYAQQVRRHGASPARALQHTPLPPLQCIAVASETSNFEEGAAALLELASKPFSLPGDAGFPLSSMMASPATPDERGALLSASHAPPLPPSTPPPSLDALPRHPAPVPEAAAHSAVQAPGAQAVLGGRLAQQVLDGLLQAQVHEQGAEVEVCNALCDEQVGRGGGHLR